MTDTHHDFGEQFVQLALAIDEHLPGYVDSYFGPAEWQARSRQTGKVPLPDLAGQVNQLAHDISQADDMDAQRKDFLARQLIAMQMSLRLLSGETVSLSEEVSALYDVQPQWKAESNFEEAHQKFDELLPAGGSLQERYVQWKKSLEIPIEKIRELLPHIMDTLRERTRKKFDLPEEESFVVEFVSNEPWSAYNWYLGDARSRIDINTDLPMRISVLPGLIAHEAYPGHHTELSIKEEKLIKDRNFHENYVNVINSPTCVVAEAIATTALETVFTDDELEEWFRTELLPRAGLSDIDPAAMIVISQAANKLSGLTGNAAFMLHDQNKSNDEISAYLKKYGLLTETEARQSIKFISNPLYRSYTFTYHIGYDILQELFAKGNRDAYFKRLLEEPVTPSQIQEWIQN